MSLIGSVSTTPAAVTTALVSPTTPAPISVSAATPNTTVQSGPQPASTSGYVGTNYNYTS
ncbi:MAG: hypothetical protein QOJ54_118 [Aliidongia sp.]|nr:hypothetical protein [Aliidongia sp.]